jgi:pyrrolidone-carboxylate peptidase
MYLSHYWHLQQGVDRPIGFVHLPLATEQVAAAKRSYPSLPVATLATAVRLLLADLTPETANERMA